MKCPKCDSENTIPSFSIPTWKCLDCGHIYHEREAKLTKEDHRKIDPLEKIILSGFDEGLTCRGIAIEIYKHYRTSRQTTRSANTEGI